MRIVLAQQILKKKINAISFKSTELFCFYANSCCNYERGSYTKLNERGGKQTVNRRITFQTISSKYTETGVKKRKKKEGEK